MITTNSADRDEIIESLRSKVSDAEYLKLVELTTDLEDPRTVLDQARRIVRSEKKRRLFSHKVALLIDAVKEVL